MADKKPGRAGKKKGTKEPKFREAPVVARKSNKREKTALRHRLYDGKIVSPAKFYSSQGNYTAGMVDGKVVMDEGGRPIRFRDIPLEPKLVADF